MGFRADGTTVLRSLDGEDVGYAMAFTPDAARRIADALNTASADGGGRAVDPLTGKKADAVDGRDDRPLSEVLKGGRYVKIVGPYATAQMNTPGGRQVRSLAAGSILPGDVTAGTARHLISVGLAQVVEAGSAREAYEGAPTGDAGDSGAGSGGQGDGRPSARASKEEWVAYVVAQRPADQSEEEARAEAEGKSKADLIAAHGS